MELFVSLFYESGLKKQELETGSELRRAMEISRKFSPDQRSYFRHLLETFDSDPKLLSAVSPRGRIRWGKVFCAEFSAHFHLGSDKLEPDQRIFLVTLCDRRCCTPDDAENIDVAGFIRIL